MTLKDVKLSAFKTLIPKTQADWLHVVGGLICFIINWIVLWFINPELNGVWNGLLATVLSVSVKELNDQFGWIKFFLSDGKTKTGFSGRDWWLGMLLPFVITIVYYIIFM